MIVVDTNLIVHLLVNGERTAGAERVLGKDDDWVSPLIWRSEFLNTLVKGARHGLLGWDAAFLVMSEAESIMAGNEFGVVSGDVLSLAASSRCSSYDLEFVVLARDLGVPLVTTDKELLAAFPDIAVSPEDFAG